MKENEMRPMAREIVMLLSATTPEAKNEGASRSKVQIAPDVLTKVRREVASLLRHFPLYPELIIDE
jgi:hypothetical protein